MAAGGTCSFGKSFWESAVMGESRDGGSSVKRETKSNRTYSEAESPRSVATFLLPKLVNLPDVLRLYDKTCEVEDKKRSSAVQDTESKSKSDSGKQGLTNEVLVVVDHGTSDRPVGPFAIGRLDNVHACRLG